MCILPNKPLACPIVSFWDHCTTHYYSGLCSNVTVVMLAPWGLLSASTTCAPQSHDPHSLQTLTLVTNKRPPRSCGFTPPFLWLYNPLFTVRSFSGGDPGVSSLDWIEGEIEGCLWGFCGCTNHILANNFGSGSNATADNHLAMINTASNVQAMNTNSSPHLKLGVFLFNLIAHSFNWTQAKTCLFVKFYSLRFTWHHVEFSSKILRILDPMLMHKIPNPCSLCQNNTPSKTHLLCRFDNVR